MLRRFYSTATVLTKLCNNELKVHQLEKHCSSGLSAVKFRRQWYEQQQDINIDKLPYKYYNYDQVNGRNCENVIGYIPIPTGMVGPLTVNDRDTHIPFATTEGALVASINRGCKVINKSGGVRCIVKTVGMTRSPILEFPNIFVAMDFSEWVERNISLLQDEFKKTTNYGDLLSVSCRLSGRYVHMRMVANCGDAMGMNMVSKGSDKIISHILDKFSCKLLTLSGNTCTDKKASSMNLIMGRGKLAIAEIIITNKMLQKYLNTDRDTILKVNREKNLIGSALAGTIGGNNAHATNIVSGIFIATGQDTAQIGTSAYTITNIEPEKDDKIIMSVTMPSLEIGTVGGGTSLEAQRNCLNIMGITNKEDPGKNSNKLAEIICSTVMAGELSLISALASNDLVKAHMKLNRKQ